MKKVALIPARVESTRFYNKMMAPLLGVPVIRRTYNSVVETGLFSEVIVATDSEEVYQEITKHGGTAYRSKKVHPSGSDRIAEAVEELYANQDDIIIVNVQGDEPFTNKQALEPLIEVFETDTKQEIGVASLMQLLESEKHINDHNYVKVVVDNNSNALYFSRAAIPSNYKKTEGVEYFEHVGVYAFRKSALLGFYHNQPTPLERFESVECLRYLEHGIKIRMVKMSYMGIEIDTPEDLVNAEKRWLEEGRK